MESGIEERAMLIMKGEKREITEGIELQNKERIRTLKSKENYKYLGILDDKKVDIDTQSLTSER